MSFENPIWLYLTPLMVLSVAGLIAFGLRKRDVLLRQFAATRLLDQLTEKADIQRILIKAALVLLACALVGITLARPQYGVAVVERKTRGLDIVFVLDSSRSMLATDLRPTRLERARLAIIDLIERLESDRIGLVVFAGNAFLQTPPTLDYSAFRENLKSVDSTSLSSRGSNIGQALREATKAFPKDDNFKTVILLTDGEDLEEEAIDTAREIAEDGIKVYSIGIGTPEGTYLRIRSENGTEEFIRDSAGQPVRSRLDEQTLRKISRLTGGSYNRLAGQSVEALHASILATLPRQEREFESQETRIERYQWTLFAAIICLVLEILIRRRRTASTQMVIALILINLLMPEPLHAEEAFQELPIEPTEAVTYEDSSDDPRVIYNQAYANLIEGDYAKAMDLLKTVIEYSDDIELEHNGLYNMAHAHNQMGEDALRAKDFKAAVHHWKEAEALFKSANELNPVDTESLEDTQLMTERRKALEKFLEQKESQEPKKDDSNSEQNPQNSEDESSESKPNEDQQSAKDNSSETKDSEADETTSGQEQTENQEKDATTQKPSGAKNDGSKQSGQDEADTQSAQGTDTEETETDSSTNSTKSASEDEQSEDESTASSEENSNPSEPEDNKAGQENQNKVGRSEGAQTTTAIPKDMELSEIQSLLDSLRNDERLLPFTKPSEKQGQTTETRDW